MRMSLKNIWYKVNSCIIYIAEFVLCVSILLFAATINYAVFARMFGLSASWVEALTVNLQVWVAMLGISLALREGGLQAIELLLLKLPIILKKPLLIIIYLFIIATSLMLVVYGWRFTTLMGRSVISSMDFMTYKWFYASLPAGGLLMTFFAIEKLLSVIWGNEVQLIIQKFKQREEEE